MCDHGHSHGCDDGSTGLSEDELGLEWSLYTRIDLANLTCLNETRDGDGRRVFKPFDQRLDTTAFVDSDADAELLFNIPFTGNVKLKGVRLILGSGDTQPRSLRLFKNKPQMSFDDVGQSAAQEFELGRAAEGAELEFPTKVVKFSSISHLSLHFPDNFGADASRVYYVGLRGEWTPAGRREAVLASYEARPVPEDHKGELPTKANHSVF